MGRGARPRLPTAPTSAPPLFSLCSPTSLLFGVKLRGCGTILPLGPLVILFPFSSLFPLRLLPAAPSRPPRPPHLAPYGGDPRLAVATQRRSAPPLARAAVDPRALQHPRRRVHRHGRGRRGEAEPALAPAACGAGQGVAGRPPPAACGAQARGAPRPWRGGVRGGSRGGAGWPGWRAAPPSPAEGLHGVELPLPCPARVPARLAGRRLAGEGARAGGVGARHGGAQARLRSCPSSPPSPPSPARGPAWSSSQLGFTGHTARRPWPSSGRPSQAPSAGVVAQAREQLLPSPHRRSLQIRRAGRSRRPTAEAEHAACGQAKQAAAGACSRKKKTPLTALHGRREDGRRRGCQSNYCPPSPRIPRSAVICCSPSPSCSAATFSILQCGGSSLTAVGDLHHPEPPPSGPPSAPPTPPRLTSASPSICSRRIHPARHRGRPPAMEMEGDGSLNS
ncbi:hypothetical protein PVAP13_9NG127473 [Panicum virgatum]|uniref:Uncharacterized protein n=1 Tax=Panicum virgatum TaxID=38727 RepID=A0A8T0ME76_PANVG|nr:hypothetical protein PVAP13_9NG127473 [Panicum virgatum]